jgi:hypothetical protein
LAFYILQRTIEERAFFELWVRRETGLDDYEVSRACTFLARSGLIEKRNTERMPESEYSQRRIGEFMS